MKPWLSLLLAAMLLLCIAPVYATEDVFTVDAQSVTENAWDERFITQHLTSDKSYLRVTCPVDEETSVTLSIANGSGQLVYQRDYGQCSGRFRSEDIYLRLTDSQTTYQVTLWVGEQSYAFPLRRVQPRLVANAACAVGYPLRSINGSKGWKSATLLDVAQLEGHSLTVPLHASGAYDIGTVTFAIQGGCLTVSAQLDEAVNGTIDKAQIQVAATALEAQELGRKSFHGLTGKLDSALDLCGTPYAAVYVNLTVSFDPAGLAGSPTIELDGQRELWNLMQTETANEALG